MINEFEVIKQEGMSPIVGVQRKADTAEAASA
jgi:hypothetical protein